MAENKGNLLWHNINWLKVNKFVQTTQKEMVAAYRKGDLNEVQNIQWKLMLSFEGRAWSVRRVTTNDGKDSPGVDNIVWNTPYTKYLAISELRLVILNKHEYKPSNIRRVWIPKPNSNELRPLGIPTMLDRSLQMLVLISFDPIVEEISDQYSYGARKFRSPHDAILRLHSLLNKPKSPKWVWDVDISKCFDNISHEFIENKIDTILCKTGKVLIKKWLRAGIVYKGTVTIPTKGMPQGGVISSTLCNLTLNGVDKIVRPNYPKIGTKAYKSLSGCWTVRFVDDIIITSPTKDKIEEEYMPKLIEFLKVRGLEISLNKSSVINLEVESLNYLGWNLRFMKRSFSRNKTSVNKSVLIVKPTNKGIARIKLSIKSTFKSNMPIEGIIRKQNPIIRGWTNYYRIFFHSQETFAKLSNYQYILWWRWAHRKHPTRSKNWIIKKYIIRGAKHKWQIGTSETLVLLNPVKVLPQKVSAMKTELNPYFERDYFENRHRIIDVEKFRKSIYIKHKYKCAACGEVLDNSEPIELHHIIPKSMGGTYSKDNIVPLHRTCHLSVTYARNKWVNHLRNSIK